MKKELLSFFILITAIGFVAAQNSLTDLLNAIQPDTAVLFATFIIVFALLFFSLGKFFKGNTSIAGIISVAIAFLVTYAVSKSNIDFTGISGIFSGIGISSELLLGTIIPIIVLGGIIFMVVKLRKNSLFAIGGLFILISFLMPYTQIVFIIIGVIFIIVRFFIPKGTLEMPKKEPKHGRMVREYYD